MTVAERSLTEVLAAAAPLATDDATLTANAIDGRRPRWVARPATIEGTARLLAIARDAGLAVTPRGAGTALTMGAAPARVDIVLDLRGLSAIAAYEPDDLTATVQAGVTGGAFAARLAPRRQMLPLDPPGWSARTLGGVAATAAAGPLRARYGTMRDLLLGVRFVQPDGVVTWGGAKVVKSVTGYDVPKLMVGALGTLGVLVELTLRLHSVPPYEATWLLTFHTPEAAGGAVGEIVDSTLEPNRVEWLSERALARCGLPAAAAALAVSIGSVEDAVHAQAGALERAAQRSGGAMQSMGSSFWRTYDGALADAGAVTLRIGTLPSRLAATSAAVAAPGSTTALCGAATVGALRAVMPVDDPASVARSIERLRATLGQHDGTVVVERAPLAVRDRVDPWGAVPPAALDLMRRIRDDIDPTRVLNPGRFVAGL